MSHKFDTLKGSKMRKAFKDQEVEQIKILYINGKSIEDISKSLKRSKSSIEKKINSLNIDRRKSEDQSEFEERILEKISDYWEEKGHTPNFYQNQYGEVRSDMQNGIPKYLTTTKYLKNN